MKLHVEENVGCIGLNTTLSSATTSSIDSSLLKISLEKLKEKTRDKLEKAYHIPQTSISTSNSY